jgi:predicted nucleic acid-binding protein
VLDTNILVSSLIRRDTPPYLLYRAWRYPRFDLLTSLHPLAEVEAVLARPRLKKYMLSVPRIASRGPLSLLAKVCYKAHTDIG